MDKKCNCEGDNRPTVREATVIEEIERIPIDAYLKESILKRFNIDYSRESKMKNEISMCHNEIERLEKAIVYLAKEVAEYRENK